MKVYFNKSQYIQGDTLNLKISFSDPTCCKVIVEGKDYHMFPAAYINSKQVMLDKVNSFDTTIVLSQWTKGEKVPLRVEMAIPHPNDSGDIFFIKDESFILN